MKGSHLVPLFLGFFMSILNHGNGLQRIVQHGKKNMFLHWTEFHAFVETSFEHCYRLCVYTSRCSSVNWDSHTKECYLNEASSGDVMQQSPFSVHAPVAENIVQDGPCAARPCSNEHLCVPVTQSSTYVCLRISNDRKAKPPTTASFAASVSSLCTTSTTTTSSTTSGFSAPNPTAAATTVTSETSTITTTKATTASTTTTPIPTTTTTTTTTATITTTATTTTTIPTTTTPNLACASSSCAAFTGTYCNAGTCTCPIGYHYDFQVDSCRQMTQCPSLADDFTKYEGKYIGGPDGPFFANTGATGCASACVNADGSVCKSFDLYHGDCYTQPVMWYDVSSSQRGPAAAVTHYQRNCKWN